MKFDYDDDEARQAINSTIAANDAHLIATLASALADPEAMSDAEAVKFHLEAISSLISLATTTDTSPSQITS